MADRESLGERMTKVRADFEAMLQELAGLEKSIAKLDELAKMDLSGFPSTRLREVAVEKMRMQAQLVAESAARAELKHRIAAAQELLRDLEQEERAYRLADLDGATTAAAQVFIGKFRQFIAALDTFRAVYLEHRAAGVKREWPIMTYSRTTHRETPWKGELLERLGWFEKALERAQQGKSDEM